MRSCAPAVYDVGMSDLVIPIRCVVTVLGYVAGIILGEVILGEVIPTPRIELLTIPVADSIVTPFTRVDERETTRGNASPWRLAHGACFQPSVAPRTAH